MNPPDVMQRLSECLKDGVPVALVTVTDFQGSVPREPGAKMLVFEDGSIAGTVGGGKLELQATQDAVKALSEGKARKAFYDLEPDLGMICGGRVEVFIDVFTDTLKIVILGGGHIGEKLAALSAVLGISHIVADERPEFSKADRFPSARKVLTGPPDEALKRLRVGKNTAVVIVTHGHAHDRRGLVAAMGTPAFYIGMIGSRKKVREVFESCRGEGLSPDSDPRVYAPIGLDLGGRTPEAIAVSILAEVLQVWHGGTGRPMRLAGAAKEVDHAEAH
jgi:xanthine dehydrogenase accessory factor